MNRLVAIGPDTAQTRLTRRCDGLARQPAPNPRLFQWKSILVPVDYGESSSATPACAAELAGTSGARLIVLHVLTGGRELLYNDKGQRVTPGESRQLAHLKLINWLKTIALPAKVKTEPLNRWSKPVGEVILATAYRWKVDLIVISGHARHFWQRLFDVKTTSRVARYAPCDVYYACHSGKLPRSTKVQRKTLVPV